MRSFINNFLSKEEFSELLKYCEQDFQIVDIGGKEFSVLPTPENILSKLQINGHDIILSFIRSAYEGFDNDLRVHTDSYISGKKSSLASILYITDVEGGSGTAFYHHPVHGEFLPEDVTQDEYFKMLDPQISNDENLWHRLFVINNEPNKIVVYNSDLFHSKYPKEIKNGVRKVLVTFYKKSKSTL
jgi:hypothetical protein